MAQNQRPDDPFAKLANLPTDQRLFVEQSPTGKKRKTIERTKEQESKRSSVPKSKDARVHAYIYERIRKAVMKRSRLGGFTFRYQREELDRLDDVVAKVNKNQDIKVSKNDVVRISLNWLLEDYDENKQASVLRNVLARLRR
jgi:hypothetical protein